MKEIINILNSSSPFCLESLENATLLHTGVFSCTCTPEEKLSLRLNNEYIDNLKKILESNPNLEIIKADYNALYENQNCLDLDSQLSFA